MQGPGFSGAFGGLIDGAYTKYQQADQDFNGASFSFGTAGPGNAGNPNLVWQGRCYQSINKVFDGVTQSVWTCYDIRTGEILWEKTGISQVPQYISYAQNAPPVSGATARTDRTVASLLYLSNNLVTKYNPMTGAVTLNVTGMSPQLIGGVQGGSSTGGFYADPNVLTIQSVSGKNFLIKWTTAGSSTNFTSRILKNISIPFTLPTYPSGILGYAGYAFDFENDIAVWMVGLAPAGVGVYYGTYMQAISMDTGQLLWNVTTNDIFFPTGLCADHGKVTTRVLGGWWDCWSLSNGALLWQTAKPGESGGEDYPWGDFGAYTIASYGGLVYDFSYAGFYAIDWNTGKIAWHYMTPTAPFEALAAPISLR
jgi:hypothetical protein